MIIRRKAKDERRKNQSHNTTAFASSQAPAWDFGAGSSSFPSREAAPARMQEVEQRMEQLPRASLFGFPSRSSHRYTQMLARHRHPGRDSHQAILPDALRVNAANLFQTDLCRDPGYMDVYSLPFMALDTRFPAGMTSYLELVYKGNQLFYVISRFSCLSWTVRNIL